MDFLNGRVQSISENAASGTSDSGTRSTKNPMPTETWPRPSSQRQTNKSQGEALPCLPPGFQIPDTVTQNRTPNPNQTTPSAHLRSGPPQPQKQPAPLVTEGRTQLINKPADQRGAHPHAPSASSSARPADGDVICVGSDVTDIPPPAAKQSTDSGANDVIRHGRNDPVLTQRVSTTRQTEIKTSNQTGDDQDELEGFQMVERRPKSASFFLCGIRIKNSPDETRTAVINYLRKRKVKATQIRVLKRGKTYMSVKLNVAPAHKDTIMSENFWPQGVQCRQWHYDNGEHSDP